MTDELVFDGVSMRLSAAIEEITPIEESELLRAFGDSWRRIRGTRNAIAHNYRFIDEALLINVVEHHLGEFEDGLRALQNLAD